MQRINGELTTNAPDNRTEEELVREHLPIVHYAVSEISNRIPSHVSRSDLVSAGMMGLAQAARSFDPDRGIGFDRFASNRIRGALLDELRGLDWASRSVRLQARTMQTASETLQAKLGRAPTRAELAKELKVEEASVHKLVEDVHRATMINYESMLVDESGEANLPGTEVSPEDQIVARERRAYLTDAVGALPERLRSVVVGYFFEERSMQEIADELGVSESRISQLKAEALLLLKDGMNAQLEPDQVAPEARPDGRVARRKAAYYAAIASGSDYRTRISAQAPTNQRRVAASEAGGNGEWIESEQPATGTTSNAPTRIKI